MSKMKTIGYIAGFMGVMAIAAGCAKEQDDKGYMIPYRFEEGKRLLKVGVNISTETRTIDGWAVDICS